VLTVKNKVKGKCKAVPAQGWTSCGCSRVLSLSDYKLSANELRDFISLKNQSPLPTREICQIFISVRVWFELKVILRPEGLC